MWHYALASEILIDEDMIWTTMRTVGEDVFLGVGERDGIGLEPCDNGVFEPTREGAFEEGITLRQV